MYNLYRSFSSHKKKYEFKKYEFDNGKPRAPKPRSIRRQKTKKVMLLLTSTLLFLSTLGETKVIMTRRAVTLSARRAHTFFFLQVWKKKKSVVCPVSGVRPGLGERASRFARAGGEAARQRRREHVARAQQARPALLRASHGPGLHRFCEFADQLGTLEFSR